MLTTGDTVFLELSGQPEESTRQASTILEFMGSRLTVELEHSAWVLEANATIVIYYHVEGRFFKQRARVEAVLEPDADKSKRDTVVVQLKRIDKPKPAERRKARRAPAQRELNVSLGSGDDCPVLDVSAGGFSVVSRRKYRRGTTLTATLNCEDVRTQGRVYVQNARPWGSGRTRYGLRCVDGQLEEALKELTMAVN